MVGFFTVSPGLTVAGMVIENQTYPCWEHSHLKPLSSVNSIWVSADIHLVEYAKSCVFIFICPKTFMCYILYECQAPHTSEMQLKAFCKWQCEESICCWRCNWIAQKCIKLLLSTRWCKENFNYLKRKLLGGISSFIFGNKSLGLSTLCPPFRCII